MPSATWSRNTTPSWQRSVGKMSSSVMFLLSTLCCAAAQPGLDSRVALRQQFLIPVTAKGEPEIGVYDLLSSDPVELDSVGKGQAKAGHHEIRGRLMPEPRRNPDDSPLVGATTAGLEAGRRIGFSQPVPPLSTSQQREACTPAQERLSTEIPRRRDRGSGCGARRRRQAGLRRPACRSRCPQSGNTDG